MPKALPWLIVGLILLLASCGGGGGGGGGGDGAPRLSTSVHFPQSVASGDPRDSSVILWTRVVDPADAGDLTVTLEVARDRDLDDVVATRTLSAHAANDGCVKVRIDGLEPGRHYWYRFRYENDEGVARSRVGRTRTAPAADADVAVRWAFFSCQDYVGRWYNAYVHLLETYLDAEDDLDFLVYLGDYIYENTGDPSFQTQGATRGVVFEDEAGAIQRGAGTATFYSARSLANYRTLYKTYRSDPQLQRLHENYPMVAVWDDHEFSDDSHGDTATYFDGTTDETDPQRKKDAERAFFEFMPSEVGLGPDGTLAITDAVLHPNTHIYDRFRFGANCEIFLTDTRTYRPDHLIPEDAFPGEIVMDEAETEAARGAGNGVEPYVDIDDPVHAALKAALLSIAAGAYRAENPDLSPTEAGALAAQAVAGLLSARYVNGLLAAAGQPEPFDAGALAAMPRGIAWLSLGKQSIYTSLGSRYAVDHDLLAVWGAHLDALDDAADDLLGPTQSAWLHAGVSASPAVWKVVGSSVSAAPMVLDFTEPSIASQLPAGFPDQFRVRLQLGADQWDGFPVAKRELLTTLSTVPDVVLISGDIHSSWLADHGDRSGLDPAATHRVHEFTGAAVSSRTFGDFVASQLQGIPDLEGVDTSGLVAAAGPLLALSSATAVVNQPSRVVYNELASHGYVVLEARSDAFRGTYHHVDTDEVHTSYYADPTTLSGLFERAVFEIRNGALTRVE